MQILLNVLRFCKYKQLCAYFNTIAMTEGHNSLGKLIPTAAVGLEIDWPTS